jgi:hypothetical protein
MNLTKRAMSELSRRVLAPIVDVHTHVYLPRYAAELRARTSAPRIYSRTGGDNKPEERLLILDGEPGVGRPVGSQVRGPHPLLGTNTDALLFESTGTVTRSCYL